MRGKARTGIGAALVAASLVLGTAGSAVAAPPTTKILVKTCDEPGAGTDASVWVSLNGSRRSTGWLYLDNKDNNFEQNKLDEFYVTEQPVGRLASVGVKFASNWWDLTAPWCLRYVQVGSAVFPTNTKNQWFTGSKTVTLPRAR